MTPPTEPAKSAALALVRECQLMPMREDEAAEIIQAAIDASKREGPRDYSDDVE